MKKIVLFFAFISFAFSFSKATPLDEVIKDIEVSGAVRYRYETQKTKKFDKKTQKYQNTTTTKISVN